MHINLFKHAKLGSLVMAGALASSMAHATTFNIGGFEVRVDTTLSAGATWLVSDRNKIICPKQMAVIQTKLSRRILTMVTGIAGGATADAKPLCAACVITQGAMVAFVKKFAG